MNIYRCHSLRLSNVYISGRRVPIARHVYIVIAQYISVNDSQPRNHENDPREALASVDGGIIMEAGRGDFRGQMLGMPCGREVTWSFSRL